MCRYYVRPTQLRLKKEYIIYYHTWTWVVFTGNQFSLIFLFCFLVTWLGTTCSKMCPMLYFLRLNRSFEPKWLFVLIHDLEWKKPNIKQNRNMSHMSSHVNKMILHCPFRVGKTRNSWNIIVLINPANFSQFCANYYFNVVFLSILCIFRMIILPRQKVVCASIYTVSMFYQ